MEKEQITTNVNAETKEYLLAQRKKNGVMLGATVDKGTELLKLIDDMKFLKSWQVSTESVNNIIMAATFHFWSKCQSCGKVTEKDIRFVRSQPLFWQYECECGSTNTVNLYNEKYNLFLYSLW